MEIGDFETTTPFGQDGEDKATLTVNVTVTDWDWSTEARPTVHVQGPDSAELTIGESYSPVVTFGHPSELRGLAAILLLAANKMEKVK